MVKKKIVTVGQAIKKARVSNVDAFLVTDKKGKAQGYVFLKRDKRKKKGLRFLGFSYNKGNESAKKIVSREVEKFKVMLGE